jgi:hypothetical protein
MLRVPVDPAQQGAEALVEGRVTTRAPEPAGLAKIAKRHRTKGASEGLDLLRERLCLHRRKVIRDHVLEWRRDRRLDPSFGRATLTQMQDVHLTFYRMSERDRRIAFPAHIAQHQSKTP